MTQIPMLIIDKLKVWKGELFLNQRSERIQDRLCPVANQDNELVDVPSHATSWNLRVVTLELRFLMLGLRLEVLLRPYLSVQMGIVEERKPLISGIFYHLWSHLLFANAKEGIVSRVIPKYAYAGHLLVEGFHIGHLLLVIFVGELCHDYIFCVQS